jgi:hypothetical protein
MGSMCMKRCKTWGVNVDEGVHMETMLEHLVQLDAMEGSQPIGDQSQLIED